MYVHKTPFFIPSLFRKFVWRKQESEKIIYLTFDDGPIPELTEFVLDELTLHSAKATFFCVGENIEKHSEIFDKIVSNGHTVGNHTHNHLNGWKTDIEEYIKNVEACQKFINGASGKKLFRPPYGRIKSAQVDALRNEYEIIMWDVLSGDFDPDLSPEKCLQNSINATLPGSIVLFHDNIKARECLRYVLPLYLTHFANLGYSFKRL